MALSEYAQTANVYRSLNKYVRDNLYTTEGYGLDIEGQPFNEKRHSEWIQFRVLNIGRTYLGQGTTAAYAHQNDVMLSFSMFVKKSGVTTADKHFLMRDIVADYVKVKKKIPLYHYVGSGVTLCNMKVRRIITDAPLPETNELLGYNLTVEADFTEFTRNR